MNTIDDKLEEVVQHDASLKIEVTLFLSVLLT